MMELYQAPGSANKLFPRSEILRKIFVELKFVVRKVTNVRVLWEEVEGMDKNVHIRKIKSSTVSNIANGESFSHTTEHNSPRPRPCCALFTSPGVYN